MIKEAQLKVLFNVIRGTCDYRLAYTKAGISKTEFYDRRDKDPEFAKQIEDAETDWELDNVLAIREAGKTLWSARAWALERKLPEKYSLIRRHELSGPGGRPLPMAVASVDLTKVMTLAQLEKLATVLDEIEKLPDGTGGDQKAV